MGAHEYESGVSHSGSLEIPRFAQDDRCRVETPSLASLEMTGLGVSASERSLPFACAQDRHCVRDEGVLARRQARRPAALAALEGGDTPRSPFAVRRSPFADRRSQFADQRLHILWHRLVTRDAGAEHALATGELHLGDPGVAARIDRVADGGGSGATLANRGVREVHHRQHRVVHRRSTRPP